MSRASHGRRLAWCAWLLAALPWAATGAASAGIHVEPYLQDPRPDRMTVMWWTDGDEPASRIEYGRGDFANVSAASNEYVPSMDKYLHAVRLTGLSQETSYDYRVRSGDSVSGQYGFKTAVSRSSGFRVAILGDGRTDDDAVIADHRAVLARAKAWGPDLVFEAGDMVDRGEARCWDDLYRRIVTATDPNDPGSDLGSRVPYLTVVGNHEITDYATGGLTTTMARFKAFASHPDNGSANADWRERYYAIRYGVATFIVLDTNNTSSDALDNHDFLPDGSTPDWEPGSEQYDWMVRQLARARDDGAFTFVLMHPAPYSRGGHGTPDPSSDHQRGYEVRALEPVFREYGVDAVFTSHDHIVERCLTGPEGFEAAMDETDPANLNWFVQGNSGHSARPAGAGWQTWMDITGNDAEPFYTRYFYDWGGTGERSFLEVEITDEGGGIWQAAFSTVQADGDVFDEFAIRRAEVVAFVDGDANRDHRVDIADLGVLATSYGQSGVGWAEGDFNYDTCVDVADLGALATHWHYGVPAGPGGGSVPEPAGLAFLGLGALCLRGRARPHGSGRP